MKKQSKLKMVEIEEGNPLLNAEAEETISHHSSKRHKILTLSNDLNSPASTSSTSASMGEDLRSQQKICFMDLPDECIKCIMLKLPPIDKAWFPFISKSMLQSCYEDPSFIDDRIIKCWSPLHLVIDCDRFRNNLKVIDHTGLETDSLSATEVSMLCISYVKGLVNFHRGSLIGLDIKWCWMKLRDPFYSLRILNLYKVKVLSVKSLIQNLPLLEELFLEDCTLPTWFRIEAEASRIRLFVMQRCISHKEGVVQGIFDPFCQITIKLNNLKAFTYHGAVSNPFVLMAPRLEEVSLHFYRVQNDRIGWGAFDWWNPVITRFLMSMRWVKKLTICTKCIQNMKGSKWGLKPLESAFCNLEELSINVHLEEELIPELASILISVPRLQRLYLDVTCLSRSPKSMINNYWEKVQTRFECLTYLKVSSYEGVRRQLQLLTFLFKSSPNLLKAEIVMAEPDLMLMMNEVEVSPKEAIAGIPKASKIVKVEIVELD